MRVRPVSVEAPAPWFLPAPVKPLEARRDLTWCWVEQVRDWPAWSLEKAGQKLQGTAESLSRFMDHQGLALTMVQLQRFIRRHGSLTPGAQHTGCPIAAVGQDLIMLPLLAVLLLLVR